MCILKGFNHRFQNFNSITFQFVCQHMILSLCTPVGFKIALVVTEASCEVWLRVSVSNNLMKKETLWYFDIAKISEKKNYLISLCQILSNCHFWCPYVCDSLIKCYLITWDMFLSTESTLLELQRKLGVFWNVKPSSV